MKTTTVFLVLFILLSECLYAQKRDLTIQDVAGLNPAFFPGNLSKLQWRANTDNFTFHRKTDFFQYNAKAKKEEILFTLTDLNTILSTSGIDNLPSFPMYQWTNVDEMMFYTSKNIVWLNVTKKTVANKLNINSEGENFELENLTQKLAFTVGNNVLVTLKDGKELKVTNESDKNIKCGQVVHRNEFGIEKGLFWSPKGNLLAFYRMDENPVTDYPLIDITKPIATVVNTKYPMAGGKSHHVTLGIYNVADGKTVFLKTGEPLDQYLTNISWAPDEKSIYIAVLNREQNHMKLNQYNATTGELTKTLFEEKHSRYVEPLNPMMFLKTKPNQFLWQSQKDGYNHVYLYDTDGKLIKQLTKGEWVVTDVYGMDEKEEFLYYTSTAVSAVERHTYKVAVANGAITKLTTEEGTHNSKISPNGKYFVDVYSSYKIPRIINLLSTDGKMISSLFTSPNPVENINFPETKLFTIKSADGKTDLWTRIIQPAEIQPNKKYPAILYLYGGPHHQEVNNSWLTGALPWCHYLATQGYIVISVDNRGSANRGFEFESCIHRQLGVNEMADQMKAIEYLKTLGYVDMDKIGITGWSYGGFMTTSMMIHHNDVFKVGVCGGPVIDWKYYEIMYGERYMDTPQENPTGYINSCLSDKVKDLKGKLLLIHGYVDPTVVVQNSLDFIENCIKSNVQVDYFLYPTHEHGVYGADRAHLYQKMTLYFDDYLKK